MARPWDWSPLDLAADPTPGDPERIRALAGALRGLGDDADSAASQVRALAGDQAALQWIGASGDAFRHHIGKFPGQLDKVAVSHHRCADALYAYAATVEDAQAQADRALAGAVPLHQTVASLSAQLAAANADIASAIKAHAVLTDVALAPDPVRVGIAVRAITTANARSGALSTRLSSHQAQLDGLKKLADQAAALHSDGEDTVVRRIGAATDAGIPPDSFWEKLGELCSKVWHGIVVAAKITAAVATILALICGGPFVWIAVAAGAVLLLDALIKKAEGKGSWWDVAGAALGCIPITEGLTGVAEIGEAFRAGGLLGAGAHLAGVGTDAARSLADGAKTVWNGARDIPNLARTLPHTALGKLTSMTTDLRFAVPGALTGFGVGVRDGDGLFGSFRSGLSGMADGWHAGLATADGLPSQAARAWQGTAEYPGIDRWTDGVAHAGTEYQVLHPGMNGFVVPDGTFAAFDHDAAAAGRAAQVGPSALDPAAGAVHGYRPAGLTLTVTEDVPMASARAVANPQYGAGGGMHHYIPGLADHIESGKIVVRGADGTRVPAVVTRDPVTGIGAVTVKPEAGQEIRLRQLDPPAGSPIPDTRAVGGLATGLGTLSHGANTAVTVVTSVGQLASPGTYQYQ